MSQSVVAVARARLESMADIVTEVEETGPNTVSITLTVFPELTGSTAAAVLNQSVLLAISKLKELQEDSLWCNLSDAKLLPMEGNSVTMNVLFSIKGA